MMKTLLLWGVLFCTLTFGDVRFAEPAPTIDKPREVVMGISGGDDESIHHALSTANNVLKFYGPEKIHLRVVAYYHGIRTLLKSEKEIAVRVRALQQYGVEFVACGNTMETKKNPFIGPHRGCRNRFGRDRRSDRTRDRRRFLHSTLRRKTYV